jgi:hypothetical protein
MRAVSAQTVESLCQDNRYAHFGDPGTSAPAAVYETTWLAARLKVLRDACLWPRAESVRPIRSWSGHRRPAGAAQAGADTSRDGERELAASRWARSRSGHGTRSIGIHNWTSAARENEPRVPRHARACRGHPRLSMGCCESKAWMAGRHKGVHARLRRAAARP